MSAFSLHSINHPSQGKQRWQRYKIRESAYRKRRRLAFHKQHLCTLCGCTRESKRFKRCNYCRSMARKDAHEHRARKVRK